MENNDLELFDAYLNGSLSEVEKAVFQQRLSDDTGLNQRFEEYQLLVGGIELSAATSLKEKLVAHESGYQKTTSTTPLFYKIAASLIFLVAATFIITQLLSQKSYEELYTEYYTPYPNIVDPVNRSEQTSDTSIFRLYEAQEYDRVIQTVDGKKATEGERFYLSQSYLALGLLDRALIEAEQIGKDSRFYAASQWYIALIHLRKQDTTALKNQLDLVIKSQKDYKAQAIDLKENL